MQKYLLLLCLLPVMSAETSLVSLQLSESPLSEALSRISRQSGVRLVYADQLLAGITISCRFEEVTVNHALKQLLGDTAIDFRWTASDRIVLFERVDIKAHIIRGQILAEPGGYPLPGARVILGQRNTFTDGDGRFRFDTLPRSKNNLDITAAGFLSEIKLVVHAGEAVEIRLNRAPHVVENIRVSEMVPAIMPESRSVVISPGLLMERQGALARDLFAGLDSMAGVEAGSPGQSGVSIRGSAPSDNLVLLDGIKLYQMDHAIGYFGAVNSDALDRVRVYKSDVPARFGGRVAGVLDLSTPEVLASQMQIEAGMDRDIGRATVRLPLGPRAELMVSARNSLSEQTSSSIYERVHEDTFNEEPRFGEPEENLVVERGQKFDDQLVKLSVQPGDNRLALTLFRSRDHSLETVGYDLTQFDIGIDFLRESRKKGSWGNEGLGLSWSRNWQDNFGSVFSVTRSRFSSAFDLDYVEYDGEEEDEDFDPNLLVDNFYNVENGINETTATAHFHWSQGAHHLTFGLTASRLETYIREDERDGPEEEFVEERPDTRTSAFYIQDRWQMSSRMTLDLGLRAVNDRLSETNGLEPRIAVNLDLAHGWSTRASWGKHHQFVLRSDDTRNYFDGSETWFLAQDGIFPGSSEQWEVGLAYGKGALSWELAAFERYHEGAARRLFDPVSGFPDSLQNIERSRGFDTMLTLDLERFFLTASYSNRRVQVLRDLETGELLDYPSNRDQPHHPRLSAGYRRAGWLASCSWRYDSGKPYDIPNISFDWEERELVLTSGEETNNLRLPPNHQLDLSLRKQFKIRRVNCELGLTVRNVYERDNILYRYYILDDNNLEAIDVPGLPKRVYLDLRIVL